LQHKTITKAVVMSHGFFITVSFTQQTTAAGGGADHNQNEVRQLYITYHYLNDNQRKLRFTITAIALVHRPCVNVIE
jgi:hypothetical protein